MTGIGTQINADFSHLDRLFGTAADWDALQTHQAIREEKGWLGIAMKLPSQTTKEPDTGQMLQAIEVTGVMPGSGAEDARLHVGDLIVGIDGLPIESDDDKKLPSFRASISKKHPGDRVKLRVLRKERILEQETMIKSYPRSQSVSKPHPELEKSGKEPSLLNDVLAKERLTDEFVRLLGEFRRETDKVDSPMIRHDDYNPFRLQEINYVMYHPLDLPAVARTLSNRLHGDFDRAHHDLAALVQTAMNELDMKALTAQVDKKPDNMTEYLVRLVNALGHANAERSAVLSVLNAGEIDFMYANAPRLLMDDPSSAQQDKSGGSHDKTEEEIREEEASMLRFFQLVLKLDMPRLLNASTEVARALDLDTLARLDAGKLEHYPDGWVVRREQNLTVIDTPAGRVLIGGTKANTYREDAALILDLGGNDSYLNHAGGSTRHHPYSVVIDLSGDDLYSATDDFSQGAGLIGGGFLIDLSGNDRYIAHNYSQGTGILGIGILADLSGMDQYSAITVAQGSGSFGAGILAEGGGNDSYFGNFFVQGAGYIKGIGAIVEVGGNDNYFSGGLFEDFRAPGKSYQSMSQGFGFGMRPSESLDASGGIGIVAEAEGNDTYVADYFAQGASYWFALGILDDRKGNDRYVSGRYAQGAGIHMSAGVLLDGEGDDNYLADFGVAQGCGHDYGIGFLLDNSGNDRYIAGTLAQGAGNNSGIGVLSDNGGDDNYHLNSQGQGRGNFESERSLSSFGFLFDTGGTDLYSQGGNNNSLSYTARWGILLDIR